MALLMCSCDDMIQRRPCLRSYTHACVVKQTRSDNNTCEMATVDAKTIMLRARGMLPPEQTVFEREFAFLRHLRRLREMSNVLAAVMCVPPLMLVVSSVFNDLYPPLFITCTSAFMTFIVGFWTGLLLSDMRRAGTAIERMPPRQSAFFMWECGNVVVGVVAVVYESQFQCPTVPTVYVCTTYTRLVLLVIVIFDTAASIVVISLVVALKVNLHRSEVVALIARSSEATYWEMFTISTKDIEILGRGLLLLSQPTTGDAEHGK